jgi:PAS domain S-box-containing protein
MTDTGFARFGADSRLVWCNAAFAVLLGAPPDAFSSGVTIAELLGEVGERGLRQVGFVDHPGRDGGRVRFSAGRGEAGELLLSARRVDSAPHQPALQPSASGDPVALWEKTSLVLECMSQGVMAFDSNLELVAWNRRVLDLLSIDSNFPRYRQPYEEMVRHIAERGGYGPGDVETLVRQRLTYIHTTSWPFYNERMHPDGLVIETVTLALSGGGFVTTYTDITERKQAERELAASRELFELAIRAAREGISQWDLRNDTLWLSPQWWELLGYDTVEIDGGRACWEKRIHPDDRAAALALVEDMRAGRVAESQELQRYFHKSGAIVHLDTRLISVPGPDGRPFRIVGSYTDVTETIRAAETVRVAKEEAERALQDLKEAQVHLIQAEKMAALGSLVAGVTHEVNTPIGIALSGASLLADKARDLRVLFDAGAMRRSDFASFMETVDEASNLMLLNIERAARLMQSFKQIAVDQASEERRVFDLNDYIHEVLRSLGVRIRRSGHVVRVSCPEDLTIDSHPGAISQILTNLVMNSIIHGYDSGEIGRLDIAARCDGDVVELVYADNGKGIPEVIQARVFEPFFTTCRDRGGSGLGLNILYTLVTRTLRGTVRLDSGSGVGATFILRFPRAMARSWRLA